LLPETTNKLRIAPRSGSYIRSVSLLNATMDAALTTVPFKAFMLVACLCEGLQPRISAAMVREA